MDGLFAVFYAQLFAFHEIESLSFSSISLRVAVAFAALIGIGSYALAMNMQVAFSRTVIGVFVGAIGFILHSARTRWFSEDHYQLQFLIQLAKAIMKENGLPPAEARQLSTMRVLGGLNGSYGAGIMGLVENDDRYDLGIESWFRKINPTGVQLTKTDTAELRPKHTETEEPSGPSRFVGLIALLAALSLSGLVIRKRNAQTPAP